MRAEALRVSQEYHFQMNRKTVCNYAAEVKIGQKLKVTDDRIAVVKKKYPYIVLTSKGAYMWSDLYLINVLGHRLQVNGYEYFRPRESEDKYEN